MYTNRPDNKPLYPFRKTDRLTSADRQLKVETRRYPGDTGSDKDIRSDTQTQSKRHTVIKTFRHIATDEERRKHTRRPSNTDRGVGPIQIRWKSYKRLKRSQVECVTFQKVPVSFNTETFTYQHPVIIFPLIFGHLRKKMLGIEHLDC